MGEEQSINELEKSVSKTVTEMSYDLSGESITSKEKKPEYKWNHTNLPSL